MNDRDASAAVQRAIVSELGAEALVEVHPVMGGEDFSAYGEVAPAVFFWVGTGNEELETMFRTTIPRFDIDEAALRDGIAVFARTALDALGNPPWPERARGDRGSGARRDLFRLHEYGTTRGRLVGLEAAEKLGIDPARVFKTSSPTSTAR